MKLGQPDPGDAGEGREQSTGKAAAGKWLHRLDLDPEAAPVIRRISVVRRTASCGRLIASARLLAPIPPRRCYRSATEPDSNSHGPDLRKLADPDPAEALSHNISADQLMIIRCPRSDVHLTYMINITLTTEFVLPPRGAW